MKQWLLGFCLLLLPCVAEAQSVADNTALQAACTASSGCPGGDPVFTGGVWRLTYGAVNGRDNGASPLFYLPQASACSLNSGNGDNGLQVKSADGKCWLARFPGIGADILQFGADPQGSSDSTTAIQNAFNDLPSNGYSVIIPAGIFCTYTGLTTRSSGPLAGFALRITGYGSQSSILSTCDHDVTALKLQGTQQIVDGILFTCRGSASSDTFTGASSITKPCVNVQNGGVHLTNFGIIGGANSLLLNNGANEVYVTNGYGYFAYGGAMVLIQNAGARFEANAWDQDWPGGLTEPTAACQTNLVSASYAWIASHNYAVGQCASNNGYLMQVTACSGACTSGSTAPTLRPYQANITDNQVTWQLAKPIPYVGLQCDTGCGETQVYANDFAGPFDYNIESTNTLSGNAPNGLMIVDSTPSDGLWAAYNFVAGGGFQIKGGQGECVLYNCQVVSTGTGFGGELTVTGMQLQLSGSGGYGFVDEGGNGLVFSGNHLNMPAGQYLAYLANLSNFVVSDNVSFNNAQIAVSNSASNYCNIVNNIVAGGSVSIAAGACSALTNTGNH